MSPAEIEAIAEKAAQRAVEKLFLTLGADTGDPLEMQKDFAFLRTFREGAGKIGVKATVAIVTIFVGGVLSLLWQGFKSVLNVH